LFFTEIAFGEHLSKPQKETVPLSVKENILALNAAACNIYLSSPDSAHKLAAQALLLSERCDYAYGKAKSFYNIGLIYWSQSYYPVSLFYLKSALGYMPEDRKLERSDIYSAIGRTYADLKNYEPALSALDTSFYYAGDDAGRLAEAYGGRSYVYCALHSYYKATRDANYSLKLNKAINNEAKTAVQYERISSIYFNIGNYKAAVAYNDTAAAMSIKINNRRLHAYTYIYAALIANKTGKFNDAVRYAQKAIALSINIGVMDAIAKSYSALVNTYQLKNDLRQALKYQEKYNQVRDSLGNISRLNTIRLVQNYYDLNAKINRIKLMEVNDRNNRGKIKSQGTLIVILFLSLSILIIILSATYYYYKQKKLLSNKLQSQHTALLEQKQLIELQTTNLKKVNNQKDKLLAVIGHDLRAPVANLSNIIEMFDEGYLSEQDVHDLMKNISPIIKGVELTLSNLVEWAGSQIKGNSIRPSSVDIYLLGVEMEQTFLHALKLKKIEFINSAYPGQGVLADENHLKVVIRNLLSNAIKFTAHSGFVTLTTVVEKHDLVISVGDTGKGMTQEEVEKLFFLNTHFSYFGTSGEKGTGIGLILCKELVELNGGKLNVRSALGRGTVFYFSLPLVKAYA
jgi:signal transduction histidine kinase